MMSKRSPKATKSATNKPHKSINGNLYKVKIDMSDIDLFSS